MCITFTKDGLEAAKAHSVVTTRMCATPLLYYLFGLRCQPQTHFNLTEYSTFILNQVAQIFSLPVLYQIHKRGYAVLSVVLPEIRSVLHSSLISVVFCI